MTNAYTGYYDFLPYQLNRTTAVLNAGFQAVLHDYGLTLTHWRVLGYLADTDGLGVSALANVTGTDQTTLSRALTVMENGMLIERRAARDDQRVVAIHLRKEGRKLFKKILPVASALNKKAVQGFSESELSQLNDFLDRIRSNV